MIELVNYSEPSIGVRTIQDLQLIYPFSLSSRSRIKNNMIASHLYSTFYLSKDFFFCSHKIIFRKIEQVGYFYILQRIVHACIEQNLRKRERRKWGASWVREFSDHLRHSHYISKFIVILIFYYCHWSIPKCLKFYYPLSSINQKTEIND